MFQRKELRDIRNQAESIAARPNLTPSWKRVCLKLADAADHLEALQTRTLIEQKFTRIDKSKIKEGNTRKGGQNPKPTTSKPNVKPQGQKPSSKK